MKQFLGNAIVGGILVIILGIFLLVNPNGAWDLIFRLIGIILLILAVVQVVNYFKSKGSPNQTKLSIVVAVIMTVFGILLLANPDLFKPLLPIICGIMIGYGAVLALVRNYRKKKQGQKVSGISIVLAIITLVLAVIVCFNPGFVMNFFMQLVGIALIIAGVTMFSASGGDAGTPRAR